MLSPINVIHEDSFPNAWARAIQFVLANGVDIDFGSQKEPKKARDSVHVIELTGNALKQIERGEVHPQYPFGGNLLRGYREEFTRKYLAEYLKKPPKQRFSYLYFLRLARYITGYNPKMFFALTRIFKRKVDDPEITSNNFIDQLAILKELVKRQKESGIPSNRDQAITWRVEADLGNPAPPCLQRIWIRYYPGQNGVDIHLEWRSRDLYGAWMSNLVGLIFMLLQEILIPLKIELLRVVDICDSLHIYLGDMQKAEKVRTLEELITMARAGLIKISEEYPILPNPQYYNR